MPVGLLVDHIWFVFNQVEESTNKLKNKRNALEEDRLTGINDTLTSIPEPDMVRKYYSCGLLARLGPTHNGSRQSY